MNCEQCSNDFEVDKAKRNWQRVKFCSTTCRTIYGNGVKVAKYVPKEWPKQKVCQNCNKDFLIYFGGQQKFCSKGCAGEAKAKRSTEKFDKLRSEIVRKCRVCDKDFTPVKHGARQECCTDECRKKAKNYRAYHSEKSPSKIRNMYKREFKRLVPIIKERDGNKCTQCGGDEKLHVHHRDNTGGTMTPNNDESNLVTLCHLCHMTYHRVSMVLIDDEWYVQGDVFKEVGLSGMIKVLD